MEERIHMEQEATITRFITVIIKVSGFYLRLRNDDHKNADGHGGMYQHGAHYSLLLLSG